MAADKPVPKGAAKNMLISFLLGFGSLVMVIGLFGAAAANGKWDDDNKWVNRQIGRQNDLHILALTIVVVALVSGVFLLLGGLVYCCAPAKHCCQIGLYTFAFFLWIGCLAAEVLGLDWSKYGDGRTPITLYGLYDFHDNADFNKYVNTYTVAYPQTYNKLYEQFQPVLMLAFCGKYMDPTTSEAVKAELADPSITGGVELVRKLDAEASNWGTDPQKCVGTITATLTQLEQGLVLTAILTLLGLDSAEQNILANINDAAMSLSDAVPKAINPILKLLYGLGQAEVLVQVPEQLDWSDYLQPYAKPGTTETNRLSYVSPVALNWTAMILDETLIGPDPCVYLFDNSVMLDSIGGWDAEDFKKVWCWNYRKQVYQENEWLAGGDRTWQDVYRRTSTQRRDEMIYDSWWAFYMYNAIFLGVQVTGFVVTIVAGFMHMCSLDRFGVAESDNKEKK